MGKQETEGTWSSSCMGEGGRGRELCNNSAGVAVCGSLPFQQGTLRGGLCTETPRPFLVYAPANQSQAYIPKRKHRIGCGEAYIHIMDSF